MAGKNDDAGKGGERLSGQRLPERALTCWRVQLLLLCIPPAFVGGFLYYTAARAFTIFTFIWMAAFLLLCFVYYPMYYRQYRYSVGGMMVRVSRGVIYNQVDAVYIRNLQYTTLSQNLLHRLMNLATLRLYAAGGVVRIVNISYEEARLVRIQLGRRMEADDGTDLD